MEDQKVLTVCHLCSTSVDSNYFRFLGEAGSDHGIKQVFVTTGSREIPEWILRNPLIDYECLRTVSRIKYPLGLKRLVSILRKHRIDILQTHLFDAAILGVIARRFVPSCKLIVSRHHLDETYLLGTSVHVYLDKWTNDSADLVVVPSNATKRFMSEVEGQDVSNVRVVPYGFDFEQPENLQNEAQKVREEFGLVDNFVIGCVGRFFKNKGHRFLFQAVSDIIRDVPEIRILLLGDGDRSEIKKEIGRVGLSDKVIFAGYRSDVAACMAAMDLLVHPSLSESFGQVIVEAMAVGTPVVVTSVGGVPEIVTDGESGLIVPPGDANQLREAILRMLRDENFRNQMANEGERSVKEKFGLDRFVSAQFKCYQDLMRDR